VALNLHNNTILFFFFFFFFCGKGNENHELGTDFLCIRESYQKLRGLSLLVIGCDT
jgi:hypothetical protein